MNQITELLKHFEKPLNRRIAFVLWFVALAIVQILILPKGEVDGRWFLFGTDTTSHNAIAQVWFWEQVSEHGYIPLWIHELRGGIPTVGAFLSTPFSFTNFLFGFMDFPSSQKVQFMFAIIVIGLGTTWLGRVEGLRPLQAMLFGTAFCLCGHFISLIYPGHMQKIATLTWTPWFFGGLFLAMNLTDVRLRLRGVAVTGFALGMTFLAGHPQISYGLILSGGIYVLFQMLDAESRKCFHRHVTLYFCIGVIAGLISSAQFLPGLEMKALSNRTEGLSFDEAIHTSYPPSDLGEYFLPRHHGDTVREGYGFYAGEWNERLISDYMGAALFFFLLIGLFGCLKNLRGRYWLFMTILSIIVGLGKFTPLYKILYHFLPGMSSFRAPAIFMFVAALGLARISVQGWILLTNSFDEKPKPYLRVFGIFSAVSIFVYMLSQHYLQMAEQQVSVPNPTSDDAMKYFYWTAMQRSALWATVGSIIPMIGYAIGGRVKLTALTATALMVVAVGWDLSTANRNFLSKEPWESYDRYLSVSELEIAIIDEAKPIRVHNLDVPQSLRQVVTGRDSLLGYQPIYYDAYEKYIRDIDFNTSEGRSQIGLNFEVFDLAQTPDLPQDAQLLGRVGNQVIVNRASIPPAFAFIEEYSFEALNWEYHEPNKMRASLPGRDGGLRLVQIIAPGWYYRIISDSNLEPDWVAVEEITPVYTTEINASDLAIEFRYRPKSFRVGLLLTGLGLALFLYLFLATVSIKTQRKV